MHPDFTAAASFLQWLDRADSFCFRTLDDVNHDATLARSYTGTLDQLADTLRADNGARRGAFVVVNHGGQRGAEIDRIRAVFADLDGADLAPVLAGPLAPHIVVESSPGKWHAYWLCDGLPLDQFAGVQRAIAARFGSDPSVCDLSRVMRLPGLVHHKGAPFTTSVTQWHSHARFTAEQVVQAFPPVTAERTAAPGTGAAEGVEIADPGTRHADLIALATRLARAGVSQSSAEATVHAEQERGRWSREMAEGEMSAAVASAFAKVASGEIVREVDPWDVFGKQALPAGAMPVAAPAGPRFKLTSAADLLHTPEPLQWLVRDMLLPATSSMLVGDPAAGKSLLVIDWAACIALGRDWIGRPVAPGFVVYLAGEGHHGIARRLLAWSIHHREALTAAPLVVSDRGGSLNEPSSLADVVAAIDHAAQTYGLPVLVVVDTLHRNLAGDENSAADTAAYFHAVDALRTRYGCHVLTVHHSGHGDKNRARGSSSLRAAVDTEMLLDVAGGIRTLQVSKQKDGPTPEPMHFQLQEIELPWIAADGEPETSVVLARSLAGPARARPLPPSLRLALDTLAGCGDGPVPLEAWRLAFYEHHTGDTPDAKKKAFRRARTELVQLQQITAVNDEYTIAGQSGPNTGHGPTRPGPDRATLFRGGPLARSATVADALVIFAKER